MAAFAAVEVAPGAPVACPALLGPASIRTLMAGLCLSALAIAAIGEYTDLDRALADAMFDFNAQAFPWRNAWLTETFNHGILKGLLLLLGLGAMATAAFDAVRPLARIDALDRVRLRIVALSALLVPLVISSLKRFSAVHCPWDLQRYGGTEPFTRWLEALAPGVLPGHCWPAGHASSALWLLSLAVYWLPQRRRAAGRAAGVALLFGAAVGWLQQLRGAHFLTHTLWSAWLACAIVLGLAIALQRRHADH